MSDSCLPQETIDRAKEIALIFREEFDYPPENDTPPEILREMFAVFLALGALMNTELVNCNLAFNIGMPCIEHFERAKYEIRQHVVDFREIQA